jgi:dTDP-4-dehydrorhamnose 3,5-epimerase
VNRIATAIPDVWILEPKLFDDPRGWFYESYREDRMRELGITKRFVQDNQSFSRRGVLRGLHYQLGHPQAKLIRVLQGEVFDVAVDLRRKSPTFRKWVGDVLSGSNRRQMYIPEGFAHGFLVMSETAEFFYKVSEVWAPKEERGVAWNDPQIGVVWPLDGRSPLLSDKDQRLPKLADLPAADFPQ